MLYGNYANSILHNSGGDLSRPSKFVAMITVPEVMKSKMSTDVIDILCKTFTIPNIKIDPIEIKFKGHTLPVRGRVNFEQNVSVTFLLDENHELRQLFKDWIEGLDPRYMGKISGISNKILKSEKSAQFGGMKINALNWDEDIVMEYGGFMLREITYTPEITTTIYILSIYQTLQILRWLASGQIPEGMEKVLQVLPRRIIMFLLCVITMDSM